MGSVVEKKATYIFKCSTSSHKKYVQLLFDYVASSEIRNKRETLIFDKKLGKLLNFKFRIVHTVPESWIENMQSKLT